MVLRRSSLLAACAAVAASAIAVAGPGEAAPPAQASGITTGLPTGDQHALVRLQLPDRAALDRLVRSGADIAAQPAASPTAVGGAPLVDLVVSGRELSTLRAQGAQVLQVIAREGEGSANFRASKAAAVSRAATGLKPATGATRAPGGGPATSAVANVDTVVFQQAYWWASKGRTFVQVEVATTAVQDPEVEIAVRWGDRRRSHRNLSAAAVLGCRGVPVPRRAAAGRSRAAGAPGRDVQPGRERHHDPPGLAGDHAATWPRRAISRTSSPRT